ncbi:MAG: LptA/OstA family protein, partial [Pseudomonadota bacterium]
MKSLAGMQSVFGSIIALGLIVWTLPQSVSAQQSQQGDEAPIEVEADDGIDWLRDEQKYIAKGNAVLKQGDLEIHGDYIEVHYEEDPGSDSNA